MRVGWKVLLPIAFANVAWVAALVGSGLYDRAQGIVHLAGAGR